MTDVARERIELGFRLRSLRELAGMTLTEVAALTGMSKAKLSRLERGVVPQSEYDVRQIASVLALSPELTDQLATEARTIRRQDANLRVSSGYVDQDGVFEIEKITTCRRELCLNIVPGLLQTPAYARQVVSEFATTASYVPDPQHRLRVRMARATLLYDLGRQFHFLIAEAGLRFRRVEDEGMVDQYRHLREMAILPNIEIGVLPISLGPVAPVEFAVYDDVAAAVCGWQHDTLERGPATIAFYRERFEELTQMSLRGDNAVELLSGLIAETDSKPHSTGHQIDLRNVELPVLDAGKESGSLARREAQ